MATQALNVRLGTDTFAKLTRRRLRWRSDMAARLKELTALIEARNSAPERAAWLRLRWRAAIASAITSAVPDGRRSEIIQLITVSGSLTVPILASFNAAYANPNNIVRFLVLGVSLAVALGTAVQQAFRYKQRYEVNWSTAGVLEAEGWAYLHAVTAPYAGKDDDDKWALFFQRVEAELLDWNRQSVGDDKTATPAAVVQGD
jgi:hypothetical protein